MHGVLDQTYSVIRSLQQASTPDEVCERLTSFTSQYGLKSVLAGTAPTKNQAQQDAKSHAFAWSYPKEWMDRYVDQGYAVIDPIIRRVEQSLSPFLWSEAVNTIPIENLSKAKKMMGEAAEFDLKSGVVIPLLTLDGAFAAVSMGGDYIEIPDNRLGTLNLVASFAMARAIEMRSMEGLRTEVGLTPREIECLKWVADGKTEWEIGAILRISEHTADKHLSNARRKLKAVSGPQAIAHAMRLGVLA